MYLQAHRRLSRIMEGKIIMGPRGLSGLGMGVRHPAQIQFVQDRLTNQQLLANGLHKRRQRRRLQVNEQKLGPTPARTARIGAMAKDLPSKANKKW